MSAPAKTPELRRAELARLQLEKDWAEVLASPAGRNVGRALLAELHGDSVWRAGAEIHKAAALHDHACALERRLQRVAPALFEQMVLEGLRMKTQDLQLRQAADSKE